MTGRVLARHLNPADLNWTFCRYRVTTDILIVMGMPVKSELTKQVADKLKNTFLDVVTSFQIKNWAIFGPQAKP